MSQCTISSSVPSVEQAAPPPERPGRMGAVAIASSGGAIVDALVSNPFFALRTHVQRDPLLRPVRYHLQHLTLRSAFAGAPLSVVSTMQRRAWAYTVSDAIGGGTHSDSHPAMAYVGGFVAGVGEAVMANPARRAMLLQQSQNHGLQTRGAWQTLKYIYDAEGIAGLFRGTSVSGVRIGLSGAAYFGALQQVRRQAPELGDMGAAGLAAMLATLVGTPLETVRAHVQDTVGSTSPSSWQAAKTIVQQRGPAGLMRGATPALVRSVPSAAVGFWVTQRLLDCMGHGEPHPVVKE